VEQGRRMVVSAYPVPPSELRSLFVGTEGSIRRRLERPPTLRSSGFDLETGDQAQTIRGELVRVANGDRKILELYRDGTFVFVCRADDWFLAWASPKGEQRLNPLALVEVIYSFAEFYVNVMRDLKEAPAEIHCRIDVRGMHERGPKATLAPYGASSAAQMFGMDLHEAPENEKTFTKAFPAVRFEPAVVAYELIREVYIWFGIDENEIPYVKAEGGVQMVDVDAIRKIK
jgi:hypothetical protein